MTKLRYTDGHRKHVVLMGDRDKKPYAIFTDNILDTDDAKLIDRLSALPQVSVVADDEPAPSNERVSQTE